MGITEDVVMVDLVDTNGFVVRLGNTTNPLQDDGLDIGFREPLEYEDAVDYECGSSSVGSVGCLPAPAQKSGVKLERRIFRRSTN